MNKIETEINGNIFSLETGQLAKQSQGSVLVRCGGTLVLVTVCHSKRTEIKPGADFVPLTVDYRERTYAAGKIPGGFFKREGRPREKEILISRLTDRSLRPLFPLTIDCNLQIMLTVLSSDLENDTDVSSIVGASAATCLTGVPFAGPVGAVRIGFRDNEYLVNPRFSQMDNLALDLIVAGTRKNILMIEGGANEISEDVLFKALEIAQEEIIKSIELQEKLVGKIENTSYKTNTISVDTKLKEEISDFIATVLTPAVKTFNKKERELALNKIYEDIKSKFLTESTPEQEKQINIIFEHMVKEEVRRLILEENVRPDGRKLDEIRPIDIIVGVLPRAHGSALFTRGETQALVSVTLGTTQDMQIMDDLIGEYKERFLFHYNFPAFATGEVRPERSPGRREIGHGALAKRALRPMVPEGDTFAYTIRVVSDILESNGSSSMASVCGGSLALMDAGVPVSRAVAGVAMGLIKKDDKYAILTDIQGMEDHIGDMDFKVAGTRTGITAIQMDLKTQGVGLQMLREGIEKSRQARIYVLDKMDAAINVPREQISSYAPRMVQVQISKDKIRNVIGAGGKTINKIQEETGAEIEIEDDGKIVISGPNLESVNAAKGMVEYYTADVEIGKIYKGKVMRITNFGAFVEILPGKEGLVHISQLDKSRVERVENVVSEGDEITVKVIEIDSQHRINLSRKACLQEDGNI